MGRSPIFSKIKNLIKYLILIISVCVNILLIFIFFFMNKEKRFHIAEDLQGTYFSQYMFQILTFQHPQFSNAYFEQSVAYNKRGQYHEGFQILDKAVDINPKEHIGYRGWMKLMKLQDFKGAISDFKQQDSLTPNRNNFIQGDDINYLIAISYQGIGNYNKAKQYYNKVFQKADSTYLSLTPIIYVNYGILLEENGFPTEAMEQYNKSLKKGGINLSEAFYHKADLYNKLGIKDSSQYYFKRALDQYNKGYRLKDDYNEVFNELYKENIIKNIEE